MLLVALGAAGLPLFAQSPSSAVDLELFNAAQADMRTGEWVKAVGRLSELLARSPHDQSARVLRARCYDRLGRYDSAILDVNRLLKLELPVDSEGTHFEGAKPLVRSGSLYSYRGDLYFMANKLGLAYADFQEGCRRGDSYSCEGLQSTKRRMEFEKTAAEWLPETMAAIDSPKGLVEQAERKHRAGDLGRAYQLFSEALSKDPDLSAAYLGRGAVAESQGDLVGARADLSTAILIDPPNIEALYRRAEINRAAKLEDVAVADYQSACRLGSHPSCLRLRELAVEAEEKGIRAMRSDAGKAMEWFSRAIQIDPIYADPYFNRAMTWQRSGQWVQAVDDYKTYLFFADRFGDSSAVIGDAYFQIGLLLAGNARPGQAIEAFGQAIAFDRRKAPRKLVRDLHQRAKIYYESGNHRQALVDLREACRMGDTLSCEMKKAIAEDLGLTEGGG